MASIAALCVHCSDSRLLRLVLQELNERRNQVHHRALAKRELLTAVSLLQNYARGGYPVDLSSGKPSVWYFDQMMRASKEFPGWKANQLGIADPLRPEYEKMPDYIAGLGAERPFWVEACGEFPVRLAFPEAYFLPLLWFHEWEEVELIAETYYDLARVLLARRIRQLEGQEEISRLEELVPELLPEVPRDPFAGKPFQRDGSTGGFYSFGPDRKDNRRKIHWNRHGRSVASPGDIELPEPNMFPPGERWGRL